MLYKNLKEEKIYENYCKRNRYRYIDIVRIDWPPKKLFNNKKNFRYGKYLVMKSNTVILMQLISQKRKLVLI